MKSTVPLKSLLIPCVFFLSLTGSSATAIRVEFPDRTLVSSPQSASISAVNEEIELKTYPVLGNTAPEIRTDINRKRNAATDSSFDAYARWNVRWEYRYHQTSRGCQIDPDTFEIHLTGTIIMPEWNPPSGADPELINRWQTYITRLHAHEKQHIQHGREAARAIQKALPSLAAPNCDRLEELADQKGAEIIAEHGQKDRDYDRRTDHGKTEGVRFP